MKYKLSPKKAKKLGKIIYDAHNGDFEQISKFCMIILQSIMDMKETEKLEIISVNEKTGRSTKLKMETFK